MIKKILHLPFFIRLLHWEFWPFGVVYAPLYLYWFWLCIKAKSFFFFNTSNPTILNGGFLLESKKEIYDLMPQQYYPNTLSFKATTSLQTIISDIKSAAFNFPLIGKPDVGMRGLGVKKLDTIEEVIAYAQMAKADFLVQEFVPYENEVGIFYYRYPNQVKGVISGIVSKEFLTLTGDGVSTIEILLQQDKRYILQLSTLKKLHKEELQQVLAKGEQHILVPYGNHSRGAKFVDISHLIDEQLTTTIDNICKNVKDFYYGRLDIRFTTWEELKNGTNFSIIEMNGAGSEPTHMYDPKHSILFAWKEIIRHWNILYTISMHNHKSYNLPFMKFSAGLQMLLENNRYVKHISEETKIAA
jgi:hypothetical protein